MPDFDTRKPQESNEPNRPRIPLIANRQSRLLGASKVRILAIASTIRHSLLANKLRSLLLGAILLFVIAPALVGLLIYSFGGFPHPQQEARQVDPRCWGSFVQSTQNSKPGDDSNDTQIVNGTPGIYLLNPDGTGQEYLTEGASFTWAPNGKKIAFVIQSSTSDSSASASDADSDIYVRRTDGGDLTRLTNTPDTDESTPDWSPDGTKIAFTSATLTRNNDIYVMNADGSGRANLTNTKRSEDYVAWSPARVGTITERTQEAIEDREAIDLVPQEYIKHINELRAKDLRGSEEGSEVQQLAYNETQQVLGGSDPNIKEKAVRFLARAGLLPSIPINFTDLRGTDLSGANLRGANMSSLNLSGVNLSNANLSKALTVDCNFIGADLSGANLRDAGLQGDDFRDADLSGADLAMAEVTEDRLAQAKSLAGVRMPDGTQHP